MLLWYTGISLLSRQSSVLSNTVSECCYDACIFYQVTMTNGERADRKTCADGFIDWLNKELKDLHYRASLHAPDIFPKHSVWNWEVSSLVFIIVMSHIQRSYSAYF